MLGACYYPEHWPAAWWAEDARRMRELGLAWVRVGEFAWSRLEPQPGVLDWAWLDAALDVLGQHGLRVVLGTPTATPPRWLVERSPEILPVGQDGRVRGFGSRRHYCFSSPVYRAETQRIVTLLAERYGRHEAVAGWQTDNEYGCHDTVRCYCTRCREAFGAWLEVRYGTVAALNAAWGTVFWSQEHTRFDAIELPAGTVTEPNPSQVLDFWRFAAAQVTDYNRFQVNLIRPRSPGRFITHNFMGFFTDLDPFDVAADLDFAAHDSYPLGFTELLSGQDEAFRVRWARTAHPDIAPFHHDWYRGAGRGRFWVMEQQPGPVNWAPWNPAPAPGMIRLWTHEALAHGAEVVSYFRWRQAPFAQEQLHAGLLRPDSTEDVAFAEAAQVRRELDALTGLVPPPARSRTSAVAFVFDVESDWVYRVQPQGRDFSYVALAFAWYAALRGLGVDVDFVSPGAALEGYRLIVVPSLAVARAAVASAWRSSGAEVIVGPRTFSKTPHLTVPDPLPPSPLLPIRVERVESLRPGLVEPVVWNGRTYAATRWVEHLRAPGEEPVACFADGGGAVYQVGHIHYVGFWPDADFLTDYLESACVRVGVPTVRLPASLRLRRCGAVTFAFNYGPQAHEVPAPPDARFVVGHRQLDPCGVAAWVVGP